MNKASLILKHFQKVDQLKTSNPKYGNALTILFKWMLQKDEAKHDITTRLLHLHTHSVARIISREKLVIAGVEDLQFLLADFTGLSFKSLKNDGEKIGKGATLAEISGNTHEILIFERILLNILQRMSGIVTETRHMVSLINQLPIINNKQVLIAATRKTPWMNIDKKAVAVGGGLTHRLSLADGILIKDNHLIAVKNKYHLQNDQETIKYALSSVLNKTKDELIEIEVENCQQACEALKTFQKFKAGNDLAIMFDNFSPNEATKTIQKLSQDYDLTNIIFEASGNINRENLTEWAKAGVDILSLGILTHSCKAANFSLEIV